MSFKNHCYWYYIYSCEKCGSNPYIEISSHGILCIDCYYCKFCGDCIEDNYYDCENCSSIVCSNCTEYFPNFKYGEYCLDCSQGIKKECGAEPDDKERYIGF